MVSDSKGYTTLYDNPTLVPLPNRINMAIPFKNMALGNLVSMSYYDINKGVTPDITSGVIALAFAEKDIYICTFKHDGTS